MAVTATSDAANVLVEMRNLFASSDKFIALVNATDYIKAKLSIFSGEMTRDKHLEPENYLVVIPADSLFYDNKKPGSVQDIAVMEAHLIFRLSRDYEDPFDEWVEALNISGEIAHEVSLLTDPRKGAKNDAVLLPKSVELGRTQRDKADRRKWRAEYRLAY